MATTLNFTRRDRKTDGMLNDARTSQIDHGAIAKPIHFMRHPRGTLLRAIHACGGELFSTVRSDWKPRHRREAAYDWRKVVSE